MRDLGIFIGYAVLFGTTSHLFVQKFRGLQPTYKFDIVGSLVGSRIVFSKFLKNIFIRNILIAIASAVNTEQKPLIRPADRVPPLSCTTANEVLRLD